MIISLTIFFGSLQPTGSTRRSATSRGGQPKS